MHSITSDMFRVNECALRTNRCFLHTSQNKSAGKNEKKKNVVQSNKQNQQMNKNK